MEWEAEQFHSRGRMQVIVSTAAAASAAEGDDSVDALADRLGYALDLDRETGKNTLTS